MKSNRAFTLIELLVVIAIIAILAAILFPVFAQAKQAAKKTQSLSNTKNLGTAINIYLGDSDDIYPQSETGQDATHLTYATVIMPYVKNGDMTNSSAGIGQSFGASGIFRSPGNPRPEVRNASSAGAFSYGVHHAIFVANFGHDPSQGQPNPGVSQSVIDSSADKIIMLEKGANDAGTPWNYPWFHDWQNQWVGAICATAGDPSTVIRDGVDVYTPGTSVYDPRFDSDCGASSSGAWECAAHPRYRFTNTAPAVFADTHAKAMKKGQIKWFQNIWIDRRNINHYSWYYDYMNGGGWGFPGIH